MATTCAREWRRLDAPVYAIGVCSDAALDEVGLDSVILEPADDYYATLAATIRGYEARPSAGSEAPTRRSCGRGRRSERSWKRTRQAVASGTLPS